MRRLGINSGINDIFAFTSRVADWIPLKSSLSWCMYVLRIPFDSIIIEPQDRLTIGIIGLLSQTGHIDAIKKPVGYTV